MHVDFPNEIADIPMRRNVLFLIMAVLTMSGCCNLKSPNGKIVVRICEQPLTYSVRFEGHEVLDSVHPSMTLEKETWGNDRLLRKEYRYVKDTVFPVCGKQAFLIDQYNELRLVYAHYNVVFRAYNEGVAYRFESTTSDSLVVVDESAPFKFIHDTELWWADSTVYSSWAIANKHYAHMSDIASGRYAITPTVLVDNKTHIKYVIEESDVLAYPGMYVRKEGDRLMGHWAASPAGETFGSWGNRVLVPTERNAWLTRTSGHRTFPWRIVAIAKEDKDLLTNELVYLLAEPSRIDSTDWIKPGKATWEWWNCHIVENAPFDDTKLSTKLYKYYIDFAAENGIEYLLVDEGWCDLLTPDKPYSSIDIREVIRYGKQKNVGTWLWVSAASLKLDRMSSTPNHCLDSMAAWGAVGIKVDFFDRDDNLIQREYAALADECAKRHLMLIYHGCGKPTGLQRTYPNLLNLEAVRGQECCKWDTTANPQSRTEILYARQLSGPMDYTPGSMRNCTREAFVPVDPGLPNTLGTRSHELALFVLLDQPYAMLCDSPDEYRKWPDVLAFLSRVPTTWDQSLALDGKVGQYALMAKQKDGKWYVGGITNWTERTLQVDCSFLERDKTYVGVGFYDLCKGAGADAEASIDASLYRCDSLRITSDTTLTISLASGGGFALELVPLE